MANSVLCTKCGNWVYNRCVKIKKVNGRLAKHFICLKNRGIMEGTVNSIEKLWNKVETVNRFCCLGDRLTLSSD